MESLIDLEDITKIMEQYFVGLYHADTNVLQDVFHPEARYINITEGDYMNKSLIEYFEILDKRTPPSSTGEELLKHHIHSIEIGGQNMAFVKASMTMMQREYCDFLMLTNDHYGWRVMTKTFTYVALRNSEGNNAIQ